MNIEFVGYALALLVGISLGLIGSGGSILTVPILVYILKIEPFLATAYSLFIVGSTALVGGIQNAVNRKVNYKLVLLFGIPSLLAVYVMRAFVLPLVPDAFVFGSLSLSKNVLLMVLFALVMFASSMKMIRPKAITSKIAQPQESKLILQGVLIGIIAGTVGAGGGFLIIPALVLFANSSMKEAVGTSLFIVAIQSLIGFLGDIKNPLIDWNLLLTFSGISIAGIFLGIFLTRYIPDNNLKKGFGYFVLLMALYIFSKEVFF
ncbi:sulfite exporter TauE/SafE family protein [Myroides sp. 1354]|uniref:sulfite exporter TauE/SafE family protein n=1 Tax=unclassified Myroides TaxID=2642485 RepID=UPI0025773D36|nr:MULTISPECIES: sulfite exporter TauE/SafE family protein [unclassified Myroides]MDM1044051.1 sulfite exporter TauE/SafE family protein [Myroides sp. R163-1]MDM1054986.1 sulfite exporter TauE/SafE family protein [Myroides sp. 1354]MDM1068283.1 sulfite exporter TauE/SafE family protein [Myroides sp. 1372]